MATTGAPASIALTADRVSIAADHRDVAHIVVKIHDAKGQVVPVAMNDIAFTVEGEGKLIGVDNGDPASHEDDKANHRTAFNGLCLAIVQSTATATATAGQIKNRSHLARPEPGKHCSQYRNSRRLSP